MENLSENSEALSPKYRVDGFVTSFEGESEDFITLHVRLRGKRLNIKISSSNFRNSPSMVKDYYEYLDVARSGLDTQDIDLMYDLFDWATKPFLPLFANQELGPRNIVQAPVTLQDFLYPETFNCEFRAVDDKFIPGNIERQDIQEAQELSELGKDFVHLMTKLQSVYPSQVQICSEYPDDEPDLPDVQPYRVCVDGQILFFKSAEQSSLQNMIDAIKKYLQVADSGPNIRTSRLYGIVADNNNPLIGLLLHYLDIEDILKFAIEPSTPVTLKQQWSSQITDTLTRLHAAGVVWGDAKPDNVLIDKHSNAGIVDFEGGYTERWVDRDKAGTVEGDLQGLANIVKLIFEEKTLSEHSDRGECSN